jgi:hypothetical protein
VLEILLNIFLIAVASYLFFILAKEAVPSLWILPFIHKKGHFVIPGLTWNPEFFQIVMQLDAGSSPA